MSGDLTQDELHVVSYLESKGLENISARVFAVILCRQYQLTRDQLIETCEYYLPGKDKSEIEKALDDLVASRGLLTTVPHHTGKYIQACESWQKKVSETLLGGAPLDPGIIETVNEFQKHRETDLLIERIGLAAQAESRDAFCKAIGEARQRIRLGVFSSKTVYPEIADTLKDAMINNAELQVQILMYSPRLAVKIEGNSNLARDVKTRTEDWRKLYANARGEAAKRGHKPKLEIRWLQDEAMIAFHRGLLIDDRLWVLNIHRPGVDRGVDGILYRGYAVEKNTNLFMLMEQYWNMAWSCSVNPHATFRERLQGFIATHRNVTLGVLLGLVAGLFINLKLDSWADRAIGFATAKFVDDIPLLFEDLGRFLESAGQGIQDLTRRWRKPRDGKPS